VDVIVNYSNEDLNVLKYQLDSLYSVLTCKLAKYVLYKTTCPDSELLKELFMYKFVIDEYVINNNTASSDNFITVQEFTCIGQRIKEIAC
jgi:hypothetical protein